MINIFFCDPVFTRLIRISTDFLLFLNKNLLFFIPLIVGALAMVYVSQPLDTVKVKMQTFPKLYTGMVNCFVTTFKRDGVVRGLYAGK